MSWSNRDTTSLTDARSGRRRVSFLVSRLNQTLLLGHGIPLSSVSSLRARPWRPGWVGMGMRLTRVVPRRAPIGDLNRGSQATAVEAYQVDYVDMKEVLSAHKGRRGSAVGSHQAPGMAREHRQGRTLKSWVKTGVPLLHRRAPSLSQPRPSAASATQVWRHNPSIVKRAREVNTTVSADTRGGGTRHVPLPRRPA